jgi:hypothetical protein
MAQVQRYNPLAEGTMTFTLSVVLTLFLLSFQQGQTGSEERERMRREAETAAEKHRQKAIRLNDLSGNIRTAADGLIQ